MSLERQLFNLKFTAKQLERESKKSQKQIAKEKLKLKKAIESGNADGARIYAENAIRCKNQSINYMRMASRIDGVASRVEAAIRMNQVTRSMAGIVQGMDKAMQSMNMEKISLVMDKFEQQFEDMDVMTQYTENAMSQTTTLSTPADQVDALITQVADEHGLELQEELGLAKPSSSTEAAVQEQDELTSRLAKLKG